MHHLQTSVGLSKTSVHRRFDLFCTFHLEKQHLTLNVCVSPVLLSKIWGNGMVIITADKTTDKNIFDICSSTNIGNSCFIVLTRCLFFLHPIREHLFPITGLLLSKRCCNFFSICIYLFSEKKALRSLYVKICHKYAIPCCPKKNSKYLIQILSVGKYVFWKFSTFNADKFTNLYRRSHVLEPQCKVYPQQAHFVLFYRSPILGHSVYLNTYAHLQHTLHVKT